MSAHSQLAVLDFNAGFALKQAETKLENLDLSCNFQKLPNHGLQKMYQRKEIYLNHLMDEVVHLQLSKEEYPISAPKYVPRNIALVEKPDKKQSIKTRFSVQILYILQILAKLRNFLSLFYAN